MKVVLINAVYQYGSTGRAVFEIKQHLVRQHEDVWVFCSEYRNPEQNVQIIGNPIDHKIHALCSRIFGLQGYFSKNATKKLIEELERIEPDVIHLHNLHANYIHLPVLLQYLAKRDIPTVLTLHDCWCFTGHCCHYTEDKCMKWQKECYDCPALNKYNKSWFFDRTRKTYADKKRLFTHIPRLAVIGNSEWTTTQARQSFLKGARIIDRIYNWIDLSVFYPRDKSLVRNRLHIAENDFVILGVSQGWSKRKGISIFINIARKFPDYKVILVGTMKVDIPLPPNIICVGAISSTDELATYYSMADVFVTASIQETFGLVSAEALACGTPIVVNNATANPELVGAGCGYVAKNDDMQSFYSALSKIRERGKDYFSNRCRTFAIEQFDHSKNIASYIQLYKKLTS